MKRVAAFAALAVGSALLAGCGSGNAGTTSAPTTGKAPIDIGMVTGVTGSFAESGHLQIDGAQLARSSSSWRTTARPTPVPLLHCNSL